MLSTQGKYCVYSFICERKYLFSIIFFNRKNFFIKRKKHKKLDSMPSRDSIFVQAISFLWNGDDYFTFAIATERKKKQHNQIQNKYVQNSVRFGKINLRKYIKHSLVIARLHWPMLCRVCAIVEFSHSRHHSVRLSFRPGNVAWLSRKLYVVADFSVAPIENIGKIKGNALDLSAIASRFSNGQTSEEKKRKKKLLLSYECIRIYLFLFRIYFFPWFITFCYSSFVNSLVGEMEDDVSNTWNINMFLFCEFWYAEIMYHEMVWCKARTHNQ